VFQSNTVFPWRTVQGNLTFPLELRRVPLKQRKDRAREICQLVQLDPERFLLKYPKELSGGESRRVGIGMALVNDSELLLLDEPTSQLDEFTKQKLQGVIYDVSQSQKLTVVLVTHDISEAVLFGTRILLLWRGRVLDTIPVNLPHPRTDQLTSSAEFARCRAEVLARFQLAEQGEK
jgi:NitT/TauT family transport system ATP-binding protein